MTYKQTSEQLARYRRQIADLRKELRAAQAAVEPEEVKDYTFQKADGGTARGWRFPMISYEGTSFGEDMGYRVDGQARPGVSVLRRRDRKILRVADTGFEPGDDFCSVWHLFDLIPEGAAGWQPKFEYAG